MPKENTYSGLGNVARLFYGDPLVVEGRAIPVKSALREYDDKVIDMSVKRTSDSDPWLKHRGSMRRSQYIAGIVDAYWMNPGPMVGIETLQTLASLQLGLIYNLEFCRGDVDKISDELRVLVDAVLALVNDFEKNKGDCTNPDVFSGNDDFRQALINICASRFDEAKLALGRARNANPVDYRVGFNKALCDVLNDDPVSARNELSKILFHRKIFEYSVSELDSFVLTILARLSNAEARDALLNGNNTLYEVKSYEAMDLLSRAIDNHPQNFEATYLLAYHYAYFGFWSEAVDLLVPLLKERLEYVERVKHNPFFANIYASLEEALSISLD